MEHCQPVLVGICDNSKWKGELAWQRILAGRWTPAHLTCLQSMLGREESAHQYFWSFSAALFFQPLSGRASRCGAGTSTPTNPRQLYQAPGHLRISLRVPAKEPQALPCAKADSALIGPIDRVEKTEKGINSALQYTDHDAVQKRRKRHGWWASSLR